MREERERESIRIDGLDGMCRVALRGPWEGLGEMLEMRKK